MLHRNLKGRSPASDPFGDKDHAWIAALQLPIDERLTVEGCLRQLDFLGHELAQIGAVIAQLVIGDEDVSLADDDSRHRRRDRYDARGRDR